MDEELETIVIIGGGPVGMEAALYARYLGYPVTIIEKGKEPAHHVRKWSHVKMFTPFSMNCSKLGIAAIEAQYPEFRFPLPEESVTGQQWIDCYLEPLAQTDLVRKCFKFQSKVKSISRNSLGKSDLIGSQLRANDGFRLLVECKNSEGTFEEINFFADIVIDCSGSFGSPNWMGTGGNPAIGESKLRASFDTEVSPLESLRQTGMTYQIPKISEVAAELPGKRVLVLGSGYSAATNICHLAELKSFGTDMDVVWLTKKNISAASCPATPISRISEDSLPMRSELTDLANRFVNDGLVEWRSSTTICRISEGSERRFEIELETHFEIEETEELEAAVESRKTSEEFDFVFANTGFRGDFTMTEPLQIHRCYASDGPIKLAASLLENSDDDCTNVKSNDARDLITTEPNFFFLGAKSYGRIPLFLFANGLSQIRQLFSIVADRENLNLYQTANTRSSR